VGVVVARRGAVQHRAARDDTALRDEGCLSDGLLGYGPAAVMAVVEDRRGRGTVGASARQTLRDTERQGNRRHRETDRKPTYLENPPLRHPSSFCVVNPGDLITPSGHSSDALACFAVLSMNSRAAR